MTHPVTGLDGPLDCGGKKDTQIKGVLPLRNTPLNYSPCFVLEPKVREIELVSPLHPPSAFLEESLCRRQTEPQREYQGTLVNLDHRRCLDI